MIEVRDLIGKPYKVHGRGPDAYDCYGLAIEACKRFGKILPDAFYSSIDRSSNEILIESQKFTAKAKRINTPLPGAVVVITVGGRPSHIGVCLGDGSFIHAMKDINVRVSEFSGYSKRIEGYYTWQ